MKSEEKILIIPVRLPLTITESIRSIRTLNSSPKIKSIALQLSKMHQDYLTKTFEENKKIDGSRIGNFYPIVNYAMSTKRQISAMGDREFHDVEEFMEFYYELSDLHFERGPLAYISSENNARWFENSVVL